MLQQNLTNVVLDLYLVVNCFTKCVLRMLEMPLHRPRFKSNYLEEHAPRLF